MSAKPNISIFFPVYNDEHTVRLVAEKSLQVLKELADQYEVLIIDDCSPDRAGAIADELAQEYPEVKVIHHATNKGYGTAIRTGFENVQYDWICVIDGDDEYDINDLRKLIKLKDFYDLIITFRYFKVYSSFRILISGVYNMVLRFLFKTKYRDISSGLRLVRKELIDQLHLDSTSPFIGAEMTIKSMLKGYRIGEVGIQTFPRQFGKSTSTSLPNIKGTIKEMWALYRKVFSPYYDLPKDRER